MALNEVIDTLPRPPVQGALGKVARRRKRHVPSTSDPRAELQLLTKQHKAWTRKAVAIEAMASDRLNHETGETIKCDLPEDVREQMMAVSRGLAREAKSLETAMTRSLREIPIYDRFLRHVFGFGPVVCAYLVSEVDIRKAEKPSNLRRFCGLAVIDGRLERPTPGQKNGFSKEMRTRLYQAFSAMWKNAAKGDGCTTKYLDVWRNTIHRLEHSERVLDRGLDRDGKWTGRIVNGQGRKVSARGFAFSTGWHKAADVLLEDLYIVWRALEGLPVWPSYYAAKLGYEHGGKISVNAPRLLSVDEALAIVGEMGKRPVVRG